MIRGLWTSIFWSLGQLNACVWSAEHGQSC